MTAPGTLDPALEEHLRSLAASHKGFKSRLTFCINVTERTIETARSYLLYVLSAKLKNVVALLTRSTAIGSKKGGSMAIGSKKKGARQSVVKRARQSVARRAWQSVVGKKGGSTAIRSPKKTCRLISKMLLLTRSTAIGSVGKTRKCCCSFSEKRRRESCNR